MSSVGSALRARIDGGGRAFVPYVTGGAPGFDADVLRGLEAAGADAVEVGIPFSDPVMDGGVIQEASRLALEAGATPGSVLGTLREAGWKQAHIASAMGISRCTSSARAASQPANL